MANTKEIQDRIKSINDTLKITNAMYMISSSKLKKSKKMLSDTEPYFFTLQSEMSRILRHIPDISSIYFKTNEDKDAADKKVGYIVITADKGLAGSYNHNVLKIAQEQLEKNPNHSLFVLPVDFKREELALKPSPEVVMDRIVPDYIVGFVYGALVESFSCEQNARMMAMEAASKSAKDMLHDLDIQYNRARQASITQEITEVIAGAKSQKKKRKK